MSSSPNAVKVSIGLPVFNGERYLAQTIDAVLGQTFQDFELIICDNASTDDTEKICRCYAARDPRIRYVRNSENIGGNRNYELALSLAKGEYFRWAACDDLFAQTFVARSVEALDRDPEVVLAYAKSTLIGDAGQTLSDYEDGIHLSSASPLERFRQLTMNLGLANAVFGLIRRKVLTGSGVRMRNFIASDRVFLAELALRGKFHEIPERLFFRRIHAGAFSSSGNVDNLLEWCKPGARATVSMLRWRHAWEHFRAAWQAPLKVQDKIGVLVHSLRMACWNRSELAREFVMMIRKSKRRTIVSNSAMYGSELKRAEDGR